MPEVKSCGAGSLRYVPLVIRNHEDGHRASLAGMAGTAPLAPRAASPSARHAAMPASHQGSVHGRPLKRLKGLRVRLAMQGAFGDKLKGVQQLDAANLAADVASVDAHLDMLRPAIASYGAKVEVSSAHDSALTG